MLIVKKKLCFKFGFCLFSNKDEYNYEGQLSLYLDKKNKPKDVASLTGSVVFGQKEPNVRGQLAFNSPGLSRVSIGNTV